MRTGWPPTPSRVMAAHNPKPANLGQTVLVRDEGGAVRVLADEERSEAPGNHTHYIIAVATGVSAELLALPLESMGNAELQAQLEALYKS